MNSLLIHSFLRFSSSFDVIPSILKPMFEADKPNVTNRTGWSKAREILSLVESKQKPRKERGDNEKRSQLVIFFFVLTRFYFSNSSTNNRQNGRRSCGLVLRHIVVQIGGTVYRGV